MTRKREAIDWRKLYKTRCRTLNGLMVHKGPEPLVYNAALSLCLTEFHNSRIRFVWMIFSSYWGFKFRSVWQRLAIWWIKREGWARECAVDIYFGDPRSNHLKTDCKCAERLKEIEADLREVFKREK